MDNLSGLLSFVLGEGLIARINLAVCHLEWVIWRVFYDYNGKSAMVKVK